MSRSTDPQDYQGLPRAVAVMAKDFGPGSRTGLHAHERGQLLYAISGLMSAHTALGSWVVPRGYALWIPGGTRHDVAMQGAVSMRTAYIRDEGVSGLPDSCRVLAVSELLNATLLALLDEPALYDENGRGGHLAALVVDEVARSPATPFALPMPSDRRLRALCEKSLDRPGHDPGLDGWAEEAGMSRRTLTRAFRAQTGLSLSAWMRRRKLLRAVEELGSGEPLAQVAARLGYRSVTAFRAMARREFGPGFSFSGLGRDGAPARPAG